LARKRKLKYQKATNEQHKAQRAKSKNKELKLQKEDGEGARRAEKLTITEKYLKI